MNNLNQLETEYLEKLGDLAPALQGCEPDFLIISPAKTGTTWLSQNLGCHPEIFIPSIKEIHYFNIYWKRFDLNWYLKHFQNAGLRKKGEATPYAGLPLYVIRSIKHRLPHLRLIFLMRDPIERAWSQAKHEYKYRHGVFSSYDGSFADIPDQKFVEHFTDLHSINIGDYLLCLRRWLACFERDQIYVGFYESIKTDPQRLLRQVLDHLDVDSGVDLSEFPIAERIFPGIEREMPPHLKPYLQAIYAKKTQELSTFLREQFQLVPPPEWTATLVVDEVDPLLLEEGYKGYNLFVYQSKFYALPPELDHLMVEKGDTLNEYQARCQCFIGYSLDEIKYYVDQSLCETDREDYIGKYFNLILTDHFLKPATPIENYLGFDITLYRKRFYAFSRSLGPVNLAQLDERTLREYQLGGLCCIADTLDAVHQLIERFFLPILAVEGYKRFNVVQYRGRYCGLAQTLGHVDLAQLHERVLHEYQTSGQVVIALSLEEAKTLIDQVADQFSPMLVVEGFQGFNVVRYKGKFFALAQSLGPIDLTQLSEHALDNYQACGQCIVAASLDEAKRRIGRRIFSVAHLKRKFFKVAN